jgi:hypothetical protein
MVKLSSHVLSGPFRLSSVFSWGSLGQVMQDDIQICNEVRDRHILEKITQL